MLALNREILCSLIYYDPYVEINCLDEFIKVNKASLGNVLKHSDIVSLHVPLTNKTTHLINYEKLRKMKNSAILINIARGKIVNSKELILALE